MARMRLSFALMWAVGEESREKRRAIDGRREVGRLSHALVAAPSVSAAWRLRWWWSEGADDDRRVMVAGCALEDVRVVCEVTRKERRREARLSKFRRLISVTAAWARTTSEFAFVRVGPQARIQILQGRYAAQCCSQLHFDKRWNQPHARAVCEVVSITCWSRQWFR